MFSATRLKYTCEAFQTNQGCVPKINYSESCLLLADFCEKTFHFLRRSDMKIPFERSSMINQIKLTMQLYIID